MAGQKSSPIRQPIAAAGGGFIPEFAGLDPIAAARGGSAGISGGSRGGGYGGYTGGMSYSPGWDAKKAAAYAAQQQQQQAQMQPAAPAGPAAQVPGGGGGGGQFGIAQGAATALGQFNPFQGQGGSTLNSLLASGNPVDVAGATQAAQSQAQRQFTDFSNQTNEEFGALGLGPSSARQAAISRGAADASARVGETGLLAGIQAGENAANRQLGALSPFFTGQGQMLGAQQGAAGLQQGLAGLSQQGSQFQQQLGQQGSQFQTQLAQQAAMQNQQIAAQQAALKAQLAASRGGYQMGGPVPEFASGGPVDPRDYLSNLAYGQTFTRPSFSAGRFDKVRDIPVPSQRRSSSSGRSMGGGAAMGAPEDPLMGLKKALLQQQLSSMRNPGIHSSRQGGPDFYQIAGEMGNVQPANYRYNSADAARQLAPWLAAIGPQAAHRGLMQTGQLLSSSAGSPSAAREQMASRRLQPQSTAIHGSNMLGRTFAQGGPVPMGAGEVPGPAVPPDSVPAWLQGGELIVPVGLRSQIEQSQDDSPLIQQLQQLVNKPAGMEAAGGGTIFEDLLNAGGSLGTYLRYGESPKEHNQFAASGEALGVSPEQVTDPWEARRAASAFRGAEMWGPYMAALFHHGRQQFGVGGGDAGEEDAMTNTAIEGMSRAIAKENLRGKAGGEAAAPGILQRLLQRDSTVGPVSRPGEATTIRGQHGGLVYPQGGLEREDIIGQMRSRPPMEESMPAPESYAPDYANADLLSLIAAATGLSAKFDPNQQGFGGTGGIYTETEPLPTGKSPLTGKRQLFGPPKELMNKSAEAASVEAPPNQGASADAGGPRKYTDADLDFGLGPNTGRVMDPFEQQFTSAQEHANALRELALQTPSRNAAIHRMAQEAQARADALGGAREGFKQDLTKAQLEATGKAQSAALPASIAAEASIIRGREANESAERRVAMQTEAQAANKRTDLATRIATQNFLTDLNPEVFQRVLDSLSGVPPELLDQLSQMLEMAAGNATEQAVGNLNASVLGEFDPSLYGMQ